MKSIKSLMTFVFILGLTYSQLVKAQTYPLLCKGGAGLNFSYRDSTKILHVTFKPGANSAPAGTLKEGECTWFDRTFNANEFQRICFNIKEVNQAWTGDSRGAFAKGYGGKSYGNIVSINMMYMDLVQKRTFSVPEFKNENYIFQVLANSDNHCLMVYREGM